MCTCSHRSALVFALVPVRVRNSAGIIDWQERRARTCTRLRYDIGGRINETKGPGEILDGGTRSRRCSYEAYSRRNCTRNFARTAFSRVLLVLRSFRVRSLAGTGDEIWSIRSGDRVILLRCCKSLVESLCR